ncbi:hypothetical protein TcCL_NonESM01958 [Trypanosoma cruzi]|nr:hypothetical protein TcCL_NonESM01958 [Trypanosoma cruzi]
MGQCSANCLPSSAAQLLQTVVCFFLFRKARMDSGFLGTVMAATACRNKAQFTPLSWPRLAKSWPPANGENATQVVAQWRVIRWAKTKCRWTHNLRVWSWASRGRRPIYQSSYQLNSLSKLTPCHKLHAL